MKVYELVNKLLLLDQGLPVAYWDNEYSQFEEIEEVKIGNLAPSSKGGSFYDFFEDGAPTIEVVVVI